jgi:taurine dioxygenase
MAVTTRPLAPAIGAEILGIDLRRPMDASIAGEIRRIWLENIVVLFRGQELGQADLLRATEIFGPLAELARPKEHRTKGHADLLPGIMLISNVRENGEPIGALPDGDMTFHHDMMHAEVPHKATLLYAVDVPSAGGNTLFASGYRAYETLPDDLRKALAGRRAFVHYNYGSQHKGDGKGIVAFAEASHPVFHTNPETGRKAIYVNRLMTEHVEGLSRAESDRLLARVYDHSEKREFVYEHVWRKGDLLVWDNRCSMHARTDFPSSERRLMWRTTVRGDERPS